MKTKALKSKNNNLIVKTNFFAKSLETGEFVFIPSGSAFKLIKCNNSVIPYYELETYNLVFNTKCGEIAINGSRVINSKQALKLRDCTDKVIDNKPQMEFRNPLLWDEVFVQSLEDIISV
ncbi:MAG: hypothetical protein EBY39_10970 [Flavobacteriia bacterium]|nr:hypothetical protein [Flavobacteriia bacterium]